MRLLTTSTIELEWFLTENLPDYSILSHTWGDDEVSFQDMVNPCEGLDETAGYKKIQACCAQAASEGLEYVWVDTCCIDKTSSAELSEAINSMYLWYQRAEVCYAYLADVPGCEDDCDFERSGFSQSRWFTRGWTLQELLAPSSLVFLDETWVEIGTKASLQELVSEITGIDSQILLDYDGSYITVAQKMYWASKRETTRVEDRAYSLMGLFGVNMPLLYGEGENAFRRLQLEILKVSTDHSLFAWKGDGTERGLLARSPIEFADCNGICEMNDNWPKPPYSMTNRGLRINLHLKWIPPDCGYYDKPRECGGQGQLIILAILDCQRQDRQKDDYTMLAIRLKELGESGVFVRIEPNKIENLERFWIIRAHEQQVFFSDEYFSGFNTVFDARNLERSYIFSVNRLVSGANQVYTPTRFFGNKWHASEQDVQLELNQIENMGATLFQKESKGDGFLVILGIGKNRPWCDIVPDVRDETLMEAINPYIDSTGTESKQNRKVLHLDRVNESLSGGEYVLVAIRRGRIGEELQHIVHITIKAGRFSIPSRPRIIDADSPKV